MADTESLRRAIHDICITLVDVGLVLDPNYPIVSSDGTCVSWRRHQDASGTSFESAMFRRYAAMLRHRDYTMLLRDGAVLQLSYWVTSRNVSRHRLSYLGAPIDFGAHVDTAFGDVLEYSTAEELLEQATSPASLRFDYDPAAAKPAHPASHLTVCGADCRIPVSHPLSPGGFVKFILQHYYLDTWNSQSRVREIHESGCDPCITSDDQRRVHVQCGA